jgi:hypothetical protein
VFRSLCLAILLIPFSGAIMANKIDSGHVVIPVAHPSGDVHRIEMPLDTPIEDFHNALSDAGYSHPVLDVPQPQPTKEGAVEYSPDFKSGAQKVWESVTSGLEPAEAGAAVGRTGKMGPITKQQNGPNRHAEVQIPTWPGIMGTIHTHPNTNNDMPSDEDRTAAKMNKSTLWICSRSGLWSVDPGGQVTHVFTNREWMKDKKPR